MLCLFFSLFRSRSVLLCAFSHTTNETNKQTRQTERNNNNNPLQVWFCSGGLGFGLGVERLVLGLIHLPSCSRCWFAASPHPGSHCPTDAPFQNETAAALSWRKSMATWKRCRTSGTIATSLGTHPTSSSSLASRGPFVNSFCFCLFHFLAHSRSLPLTPAYSSSLQPTDGGIALPAQLPWSLPRARKFRWHPHRAFCQVLQFCFLGEACATHPPHVLSHSVLCILCVCVCVCVCVFSLFFLLQNNNNSSPFALFFSFSLPHSGTMGAWWCTTEFPATKMAPCNSR